MRRPKDAKPPRSKKRSILIGLLVFSVVAAYYFFSLAGFNVWQSAFPENSAHLDVLEYRTWLFGALSAACIGLAVFLTVAIIRISR
jgi:hypothetical protein